MSGKDGRLPQRQRVWRGGPGTQRRGGGGGAQPPREGQGLEERRIPRPRVFWGLRRKQDPLVGGASGNLGPLLVLGCCPGPRGQQVLSLQVRDVGQMPPARRDRGRGLPGTEQVGVAAAGRGKQQPLRPGERALRVPCPTPGH
uniref:Uncharacterized protein n=1 Tax=Mustela putorius furo TaxID=9669 RepID=M3YIN9_MUSPF